MTSRTAPTSPAAATPVDAPAERPSPRPSLRSVVGSAGPAFLTLDVAARLPAAMFPLGVLLLVQDRTGSYAEGGLAVAALSVGGGVGGPLVGALADRVGQRLVAVAATLVQVLSLATLLLVPGAGTGPTLALVAALGLANPQAGAMARTRWSARARGRADERPFVSTAMAFEGSVDEVSFVLGPVVVGTVATLVAPTAALVLALAVAAGAQVGFGLHPSALPGRGPRSGTRTTTRASLPVLPLLVLLLALLAVGTVFGATQTGVAARLALTGDDGLTGVVYGCMGVGSAVTALLTTRLPERFTHQRRIVASGALLVVAGWLLSLASAPGWMGAANLLVGVAVAPTLISAYALAERLAPAGWATTTMTALATANVVGVATGAALAGSLVDGAGPGAALRVLCASGAAVLLCGLAALRVARRA